MNLIFKKHHAVRGTYSFFYSGHYVFYTYKDTITKTWLVVVTTEAHETYGISYSDSDLIGSKFLDDAKDFAKTLMERAIA